MLILEWIIVGFFSAVGWKGADIMFEKMGWEPTSVSQQLDTNPKQKQDENKNHCIILESPKLFCSIRERGDESVKQ